MTSPFGPGAAGVPGGAGCPCGSGAAFDACCGAIHAGSATARTAEELMRSRYAAFAAGDEGYLLRSWHPATRPESLRLDPGHRWVRLEVLDAVGGPGDEAGTVTYRAHAQGPDGRGAVLTERARFGRRGGRWVYVGGEVLDA